MADGSNQPSGMNLGGVISEKLTESIKNMDLISVLQKMVAVTPEDEQSEEIREKLKGVLEQYSHMSDDEKESLTSQMKEVLASRLSTRLNSGDVNLGGFEDAIRDAVMYKLYMVAAGVILLIFIIVFFGYKLYKSLKDKEKKREEKKKVKQMKKKK